MKVALITDQHFGARNDSPHFLNFYEKFYSETFFPTLEKENITTVLILGDTFDRRKYVNFYSLKRAKEMFFDVLSDKNMTVYMLTGNHDTYFKNTNDVNSVDLLLKEYKNIFVIDKPQTVGLFYPATDNLVCMIPWICPENEQSCMNELKDTKASICIGHFEIQGFQMYRGMPSEEGLDRGLFDKFEYTFSGHYHHKSSAGDIHYLGNPYEITWQDFNDDRGFHIFDMDSKELRFIKNPNSIFYRIKYDDKTNSINEINNWNLDLYKDKYVKVVVLNKTNPYLFDRFMARLYEVNPIDITIVEDSIDLTETLEDDKIDEAEDTITIINKYVDALENDGIDNNKLKNILRELYIEALNSEQA